MTTPRKKAAATARKATATKRRRSTELVKVEEQRRIVNLWLAGARHDEIANAMKLSESTVYRVRRAALEAATPLRDAAANELREVELQRLDRLQRAHWEQALKGNVGSSKIVLSCIDRRAKMLGLDAQIEALVSELEAGGLVKLTAD